jgi:hypothetical protein
MTRHNALRMLSSTRPFSNRIAVDEAARALNCTRMYVRRWPEELPRTIADRVIGHCFRKEVAQWVEQGRYYVAERLIDAAALRHPDDQHGMMPIDDELDTAAA